MREKFFQVKLCLQIKKVDVKEMMAHVATVISLLTVSNARLQQIVDAKEEASVFRQTTTHC